MKDVRGILPEKKEIPHRLPKYLKDHPQRLHSGTMTYTMCRRQKTITMRHHKKRTVIEYFSNMQINNQCNEQSDMLEDAFNENYQSVEESETAI